MAATLPDQVAILEKKIRYRFPEATVSVDAPSDPRGGWFLDVSLRGHVVGVQWRSDRRFGITTNPSSGGYGEGVHETYEDVDHVFNRVVSLLLGTVSTVPPLPVRLRELRALREISQVELADSLNVQQAAVSRLEHRKDNILLSTLKAVVAAMGGELKVTARFPDGVERELQLDDETDRPTPAPAESARRS